VTNPNLKSSSFITAQLKKVDKMCADYSAARKTCWWPVVIFNSMLNKVAINVPMEH
jgi:hypothetical protein